MPGEFDAFSSGVGIFHGEPVETGTVEEDEERYVRGGLIGSGGMGEVRAAQDVRLAREVALKRAHDLSLLPRLVREVRITAQLEHPGIVTVYDAGTDEDGRPFYTMRMIRGRSLAQVAEETGGLEERLALLRPMLSVCEAVAFAHSLGVVHRDLKPANVMLGAFGEVQVVDWGLASVVPEAAERWRPVLGDLAHEVEGAAGTPKYMSPEAARGELPTRVADVWSLGVMLFELLLGETLWKGESWEEVLEQVRTVSPDLSRLRSLEVESDLLAIVDKALASSSDARYPDAAALAQDLQRFLDGHLVGAHAYTPFDHLRRVVRLWKAPLMVGAIGLAALALLAADSFRRVTVSRDRAVLAQQIAERARGESQIALSRALLQRAEQARWDGDRAVAELAAARSLSLHPTPGARGVLAAYASSLRPRRVSTRELPECERWSLAPAGGLAVCRGAETYGVYDVDAEVWRFREPAPADLIGVLATDDFLVVLRRPASEVDAGLEVRSLETGEILYTYAGATAPNSGHHERTRETIAFGNTDGVTFVSASEAKVVTRGTWCPRKINSTFPIADGDWGVYCPGHGVFRVGPGDEVELWPGTEDVRSDKILARPDRLLVASTDGRLVGRDGSGTVLFDRRLPFVASWMQWWGELAVVVGENGRVAGLLPETGQIVWSLPVSAGLRGTLAGEGDGLLVLERDVVSAWEVPSHGERAFSSPYGLTSVAFDPDGRWLVTGNGASTVTVWDLASHRVRMTTGMNSEHAVIKWVDLDPTSERILFAGVDSPNSYQQAFDGERVPVGAGGQVRRVAYFEDGSSVLLGYNTKALLRLPRDGQSYERLELEGPCWDLEPDVTRTSLALSCSDGRVALVHQDGRSEWVGTFPEVRNVAPGRGGQEVALGWAEEVRIVSHTGELITSFEHPYHLLDVAISPDGQRIATGSLDGVVRVFTRDGTPLMSLEAHGRRVPFVRFTHDGYFLWSAGWDGVARQWGLYELETPAEVAQKEIERDWGLTLEDL